MTTVKGPVTTAVDVAGITQTTKRRTQKAYEDILGRTFKTEIWDLDGGGSAPYSTVKTTFNGRDQAVLSRQYAGADGSSTFQDTTATFDGHGRLASSHKPEQRDASNNLKYTTYSYNADDSITSVTDGRGAVTNYTYENVGGVLKRPLVTGISWTVPTGSGITDPADVSYTFDNAGNRTAMTDGLGTQSYSYDSLSRMISESRAYNTTDAGFANNTTTLSYTYSLGGQLGSYGASFDSNRQVSYAFDKIGRLTGVTGTYTGGSTNYVTGAAYRAGERPSISTMATAPR